MGAWLIRNANAIQSVRKLLEHEQRPRLGRAPAADVPEADAGDSDPEQDPGQRIDETVPLVDVDIAVIDDLAVEVVSPHSTFLLYPSRTVSEWLSTL